MRKVLLPFEGVRFPEKAFAFALELNKAEKIQITALSLPQTNLSNLWSYAGDLETKTQIPLIEEQEAEVIDANIAQLSKRCQENDIELKVHRHNTDFGLSALRPESRFADLMLVENETFNDDKNGLDELFPSAIYESECPVVIVSSNSLNIKCIILAYDGSKSSVYAIKQFAYLFPNFNAYPTLLVNASENDGDLPHIHEMEELAERHFSNLDIIKLQMSPKYFRTWITDKPGALLVTGSFGRSAISNLLIKSFAMDIVKDNQITVFSAHY
jgi:hypothetical protein